VQVRRLLLKSLWTSLSPGINLFEAEELLEGAIEVQQDLERGVQSGYKTLLAHLQAYLVHLLNIQHLHS